MPSSRPTASATCRASPVIITTSTPSALQLGDRLAGLGPDLVLEREGTDDLGRRATRYSTDAPRSRPRPGPDRELGGHVEPRLAEQRRPADGVRSRRRPSASTPRPVDERKSVAAGTGPSAAAPAATMARASGCSLSASTAPASASTSASSLPGAASHAGDRVGAAGQGAGLVEEHGVDGAHPLEGQAVLHQDPVAGRHRGRERDHQRDRQAEGVGAGDHQHGDGAVDGRVEVAERAPTPRR